MGCGRSAERTRTIHMATTTATEHVVTVEVGDSTIELSTGRLAKQADGAVLVRSVKSGAGVPGATTVTDAGRARG